MSTDVSARLCRWRPVALGVCGQDCTVLVSTGGSAWFKNLPLSLFMRRRGSVFMMMAWAWSLALVSLLPGHPPSQEAGGTLPLAAHIPLLVPLPAGAPRRVHRTHGARRGLSKEFCWLAAGFPLAAGKAHEARSLTWTYERVPVARQLPRAPAPSCGMSGRDPDMAGPATHAENIKLDLAGRWQQRKLRAADWLRGQRVRMVIQVRWGWLPTRPGLPAPRPWQPGPLPRPAPQRSDGCVGRDFLSG